jgi:hypothetical protein
MIALAIAVKGRTSVFQDVIHTLASQTVARRLNILILDGNPMQDVFHPPASQGIFSSLRVWREEDVIGKEGRGRWPVLYNFLLRQTADPYLTYWSDVFPDHRECFEIAMGHLDTAPQLGGICFPWRDGSGSRSHIYRTERHNQPLVNFGLLRRTAFEEVGMLDERFHFYYGDQDLSLRLWKKGWPLAAPDEDQTLTVTHYSGEKADNVYRLPDWVAKDRSTFHQIWG